MFQLLSSSLKTLKYLDIEAADLIDSLYKEVIFLRNENYKLKLKIDNK